MNTFIQYTLYGLMTGSVYAIAATGLVVTYATSGIFNFAHGAVSMLAAFTYWQLRVGWHWPVPIALGTVLLVLAPLFGILVHRLNFARLDEASETVRLIVPVAVMLFAIALANWVWNPARSRSLPGFFGEQSTVDIGAAIGVGSVPVTYHQLLSLGTAVLVAAALWVLQSRSRVGVAMRAAVDDPDLLRLHGGSPDRAAVLAWAIGGALAALAGVLITPILGGSLNAILLTLLVINAYAAALFGQLRSLPATFGGAMVLGLLNSWTSRYLPADWTWRANLRLSVPMILLFAVLLVLPPQRLRGVVAAGTTERFAVPRPRIAIWGAVALVVAVSLLSLIMSPGAVNQLGAGLALALIALSLVPLTGHAGEVNFGVMAFAGIGALVLWHTPGHGAWWGYGVAALVAGIAGALVALPAARLRGLYLALGTAAFGVLVSNMVFDEARPRQVSGTVLGWAGLAVLAIGVVLWLALVRTARRPGLIMVALSLFSVTAMILWLLRDRLAAWHSRFSLFETGSLVLARPAWVRSDRAFLITLAALFAAVSVGLVLLRRGPYGRRLVAMKDSPVAYAVLGYSVVRLKVSVFALSAAIAGLGGALYAAQLRSVTPDRFILFASLSLVMLAVVGGIGHPSGALFAGLLLAVSATAVPDTLTGLGAALPALHGLFDWLSHASTLLPALVGIALSANPSGAVADIVQGYAPLRSSRLTVALMIALLLAAWLLDFVGVLGNWAFTGVVLAVLVGVPRLAMVLRPATFGRPVGEVPLELLGIDRPFTETDRRMLDRALDIGSVGSRR